MPDEIVCIASHFVVRHLVACEIKFEQHALKLGQGVELWVWNGVVEAEDEFLEHFEHGEGARSTDELGVGGTEFVHEREHFGDAVWAAFDGVSDCFEVDAELVVGEWEAGLVGFCGGNEERAVKEDHYV